MSITTSWTGSAWTGADIEYSINGGTWQSFVVGNTAVDNNTCVVIAAGASMELRGTTGISLDTNRYSTFRFVGNGTVDASGSVQSLYGNDCSVPAFCYKMFLGQTKLTSAPEFPATVLSRDCYCATFRGCTGLTKAPSSLPAKTAEYECYCTMFDGCSALTGKMPTIELESTAQGCMLAMFRSCTHVDRVSISTPWSVLSGTLPQQCFGDQYNTWLGGCAATGVIECTSDVAAHASAIAYFLPSGWSVETRDFQAEHDGLLLTLGNLRRYHTGLVADLETTCASYRANVKEPILDAGAHVESYRSRVYEIDQIDLETDYAYNFVVLTSATVSDPIKTTSLTAAQKLNYRMKRGITRYYIISTAPIGQNDFASSIGSYNVCRIGDWGMLSGNIYLLTIINPSGFHKFTESSSFALPKNMIATLEIIGQMNATIS